MQPMQAAGHQNWKQDRRGDDKDQQTLPPSRQPPTQEGGQRHDQGDLEQPENIAVEPRVPIADRTAEHPVRDGPELAAGVIVMGQEIRKGMQETGTRKARRMICLRQTANPSSPPQKKKLWSIAKTDCQL